MVEMSLDKFLDLGSKKFYKTPLVLKMLFKRWIALYTR